MIDILETVQVAYYTKIPIADSASHYWRKRSQVEFLFGHIGYRRASPFGKSRDMSARLHFVPRH